MNWISGKAGVTSSAFLFHKVVKLKLVFVPKVSPKVDWMFWFKVIVYVIPDVSALVGVRVIVRFDDPPVRLGQEGEQEILVLRDVGSIAWVMMMVIVGLRLTPVAPLAGVVDSMVKVADVWVTRGKTRIPSKEGDGSGKQCTEEKTNRNINLILFHMTIGSILSFD